MKCRRSSIFWDVRHHRLAVIYRRFGQKLSTPSLRVNESKKKIQTKSDLAVPKTEPWRPAVDVCVLQPQETQDERTTRGEASSLQDVAIHSFVYFNWFWPTVLPDSDMDQGRLSTCNLFGPSSIHLQGIPLSYLDRVTSHPDKRFPLNFSLPTA